MAEQYITDSELTSNQCQSDRIEAPVQPTSSAPLKTSPEDILTETIANVESPTATFERKQGRVGKACAKMAVRSGLRCVCHFDIHCPNKVQEAPRSSQVLASTDGYQYVHKDNSVAMQRDLEALLLHELVDACRNLGLSTEGCKADLIARLITYANSEMAREDGATLGIEFSSQGNLQPPSFAATQTGVKRKQSDTGWVNQEARGVDEVQRGRKVEKKSENPRIERPIQHPILLAAVFEDLRRVWRQGGLACPELLRERVLESFLITCKVCSTIRTASHSVDVVFHRTNAENIQRILEVGLLVADGKHLPIAHGTKLGKGVYASRAFHMGMKYGNSAIICLALPVIQVPYTSKDWPSGLEHQFCSKDWNGCVCVYRNAAQVLPLAIVNDRDIHPTTAAAHRLAEILQLKVEWVGGESPKEKTVRSVAQGGAWLRAESKSSLAQLPHEELGTIRKVSMVDRVSRSSSYMKKTNVLLQLVSDSAEAKARTLPHLVAADLRVMIGIAMTSLDSDHRNGPLSHVFQFGRQEIRDKVPADFILPQQPGMPAIPVYRCISRDVFAFEEKIAEASREYVNGSLDPAILRQGETITEKTRHLVDESDTLLLDGPAPAGDAPQTLLTVKSGKNGFHYRPRGESRWRWLAPEVMRDLQVGDRIALILQSPRGTYNPAPQRDLQAEDVTCLLGVEIRRLCDANITLRSDYCENANTSLQLGSVQNGSVHFETSSEYGPIPDDFVEIQQLLGKFVDDFGGTPNFPSGCVTLQGKLRRRELQALSCYEYIALTVEGFGRLQQHAESIQQLNNGRIFHENPGTQALERLCGLTMHADRPGCGYAIRQGPQILLAAFRSAKQACNLRSFFENAFDRHSDPCLEGRISMMSKFLQTSMQE